MVNTPRNRSRPRSAGMRPASSRSTQTKMVIAISIAVCALILGAFFFFPGDNFRAGPQATTVESGGKPGSGPPLVDNDPPPPGRLAHPPR